MAMFLFEATLLRAVEAAHAEAYNVDKENKTFK